MKTVKGNESYDRRIDFEDNIESLIHLDGFLRSFYQNYRHDYHKALQAAISLLKEKKEGFVNG
jgi:hypothetical protein